MKLTDEQESSINGVQWLPDGSAFTFQQGEDIYRHVVESGTVEKIVSASDLKWNDETVDMSDYHTTGEQNHLLIAGTQKQIWRHSFSGMHR